jgi:hypothetical protein
MKAVANSIGSGFDYLVQDSIIVQNNFNLFHQNEAPEDTEPNHPICHSK